MNISLLNVRTLRWAAPTLVAATVVTLAGTGAFSSSAEPTTGSAGGNARLVAAISSPQLPPLTGTLRITADQRAPQTVQVWLGTGGRARLHANGLDIVLDRNGAQLWSAQRHTAVRIPASAAPALDPKRALESLVKGIPRQLGTHVTVTVAGETTVAGRRARVVELAPKDGGSPTVRVSLDEATRLPLAAELHRTPGGRSDFAITFTRLHLGAPSPTALRFAPPAGTTVHTVSSTAGSELVADAARLLAAATGR